MPEMLTLDAGFDRSLAWDGGGSVRYLVGDVQAPDWVPSANRTPLNLALVIDRSGSMSGAPLEAAKQAAAGIVERLAADDRISIVSFDTNVIVHADGLAKGTHGAEVVRAVRMIEPGGSTDLSAGWIAGGECLARVAGKVPGMRNHVVVLSDGHANAGIVAPELLEHLASQMRAQGVTTSCVGIGDGYSTLQLLALADHGGGRLHDAEHPQEIVEVVLAELNELSAVTADDVQISVTYDDSIRAECVGTFPTRVSPGRTSVTLGSLVGAQAGQAGGGGRPRPVVFRMFLPAGTAGVTLPFGLEATWRRPGETGVRQVSASAVCSFAGEQENGSQVRDLARSLTVAREWQSQVVRRVVDLNREGAFVQAKQYVTEQLVHFRRYCQGLSGAEQLVAEMERVLQAAGGDWGERNRKEVHLAKYKQSRGEADFRRNLRADWTDFVPPGEPKA